MAGAGRRGSNDLRKPLLAIAFAEIEHAHPHRRELEKAELYAIHFDKHGIDGAVIGERRNQLLESSFIIELFHRSLDLYRGRRRSRPYHKRCDRIVLQVHVLPGLDPGHEVDLEIIL